MFYLSRSFIEIENYKKINFVKFEKNLIDEREYLNKSVIESNSYLYSKKYLNKIKSDKYLISLSSYCFSTLEGHYLSHLFKLFRMENDIRKFNSDDSTYTCQERIKTLINR